MAVRVKTTSMKQMEIVYRDNNYMIKDLIDQIPLGQVVKTYFTTIDLDEGLIMGEQLATVQVAFIKEK